MTPPLIRMPNGDAVRADQVLGVRTSGRVHWGSLVSPASVIVDTPHGHINYDIGTSDQAEHDAATERDRIIAEVNAACGGATEPVVATAEGGAA